MFTVCDASSIVGERKGTSGSWKGRVSDGGRGGRLRARRLDRAPRAPLGGLPLDPQARRHAPDAAVRRRRPPRPEPDDMALALALAAVLAGDDPDVVTHARHRLIGEADVLVHTARMRVAIRADDADAQGRPS